MNDFPEVPTDRLRLRKPTAADIPSILEYANNPKIEEMTLSFPYPYYEKDAISWLDRANKGLKDQSNYIFAICLLETNEFVGGIGFDIDQKHNRAELGFWVGEPFWNQGYITEATKEVLRFGFEEVGLHKIYAHHMIDNPASGKVMTKNGMIKEGQLKDHIKKGDQYKSVVLYRLTKEEYVSHKERNS